MEEDLDVAPLADVRGVGERPDQLERRGEVEPLRGSA